MRVSLICYLQLLFCQDDIFVLLSYYFIALSFFQFHLVLIPWIFQQKCLFFTTARTPMSEVCQLASLLPIESFLTFSRLRCDWVSHVWHTSPCSSRWDSFYLSFWPGRRKHEGERRRISVRMNGVERYLRAFLRIWLLKGICKRDIQGHLSLVSMNLWQSGYERVIWLPTSSSSSISVFCFFTTFHHRSPSFLFDCSPRFLSVANSIPVPVLISNSPLVLLLQESSHRIAFPLLKLQRVSHDGKIVSQINCISSLQASSCLRRWAEHSMYWDCDS